MFRFLKKKVKKFEDELEAELEKEAKTETKPVEKKKTEKKEERKTEKPAKKELPEVKTTGKPKVRKRTKKKEEKDEKTRRAKETDKQIEKSLETELEHTLRARKGIEDVVKKEKRTSRGIKEEKLEELLWDLEIGLLESDVAYSVIESIKQDIKDELKNVSIERSKVGEIVEQVLRNSIANVLKANDFDFEEFIDKKKKPVVIMFVGVNGSGKTLTIGKIATLLKKMDKSCVMAAGDTFRAGAIEQLQIHADNIGVKLVKHGPSADPAAVAFDAIEHAKAKHKDVVLLDTAGRMQNNVNLMDEMAKIKRVAKPDLILFVGDALAGNDAVEQAKRFNETVGIDGVVLTKVDTDAKGGSALSVAYTIGKPLLFVGIGQKYEDQIPFDPHWMLEKIFGK